MANTVQRMLALPSGRRVPMKLDPATWQAIDWIADQHAQSWQEWAGNALTATDESENLTAALREAAMSGLMEETIFQDRAGQLAAMERHALVRDSGMLDDQELDEILKKSHISGRSHFGGFEIIFGFDEHAQDCIWIRNGMRDGLHFAFVVPNEFARSFNEEVQP